MISCTSTFPEIMFLYITIDQHLFAKPQLRNKKVMLLFINLFAHSRTNSSRPIEL